jgi:hypothetical protein
VPPLRTRERRGTPERRGTTLVPTATSYVSRSSAPGDDGDVGDAQGRIYTATRSAGGRKVAGSNPVAPIEKLEQDHPLARLKRSA